MTEEINAPSYNSPYDFCDIPLPGDDDAPLEGQPGAFPYEPSGAPFVEEAPGVENREAPHIAPEDVAAPSCSGDDFTEEDVPVGEYVPLSALPNLPIPSYLVSAANVVAKEHRFLLDDKRFPLGEVSIIAGAGGTGKGQLACAHMALTSRGYNLAGKKAGVPQRCLFITAEDTEGDVKRRLERSCFRADSTKIFIADKVITREQEIDLSSDDGFFMLMGWINSTGAKLVYLDPLQAFVGEYTDLSRQNHVRRIMHSLTALAEETDCCIVLLMHLNKRQTVVSAADLLCGSSDIVNASRSAMLLTNDFRDGDRDRRYLFHIKSNHARSVETLEINISSSGNRIVGESELTPEDYVQAVNTRRASKSARAEVNFEQMFYSGIEQMIANGESQSTFREFVRKYAPGFNGRAKCVIDDITARVEEKLGYTIQTMTSNCSAVKLGTERGFRLVNIS